MKLLFIHSDYIEYECTKEALRDGAEEISEERKTGKLEEALTVFTSVEKYDEDVQDAVVAEAVKQIRDIAEQVKTNRVMIYPYAHLSSELASPKRAREISIALGEAVEKTGLEVKRSPFGWYKAFKISCKGHPLSELAREIRVGTGESAEISGEVEKEIVSEAVKAEEELVSEWYILDVAGTLHGLKIQDNHVEGYDFGENENLKKFCEYEMAKSRTTGKHPPHIDIMRRLELVDYEPASDPGNFRYYPKGKLIKSLLETYITKKVKEYGGMEIESPIMYDFEHPSLKEYVNRFPARQYTIQTPDKKVFLRFAACFGQFLMAHDANISYKQLPLKLYELTHYSFRVEQRGELAGLRRLRTFTMPDCHAFCADLDMAKTELEKRFELSNRILKGIGFDIQEDIQLSLRVTKDFYEQNKEFIELLVVSWGRPVLLEMWSERFFYFIFKYDGNFVDSLGKASALSTDQIDVENGERYGIEYVSTDGKKHHPLILHQSPSGAIERVIYALLERAYLKSQKGEKPVLPFWLAPTQIRLIPVREEFNRDCMAIADALPGRIDVDDRDEKVGKKIRDAEREWINLIIVFGDKERESGVLPVRQRTGAIEEMGLKELKREIDAGLTGYPFFPLPIPKLLSKRIIFRG
ncbi:threonine--tRNA ligase [[Eubacterium] cellulosolvens]